MKVSETFLNEEIEARAAHTPQRWNDTTPRFKHKMIYFDAKWDPDTLRDFTLWIGHSLVDQSVSTGKPLAALILKRLDAAAKNAFPRDQVGFWLNLERKPDNPLALHVHGIVRTDNPELFRNPAHLDALRRAIRGASGSRHVHSPARVLDMRKRDVGIGWWKTACAASGTR